MTFWMRCFLDEALSHNVAHIDDLPLLGDAQVALSILFSCVAHRPSYRTWTILLLFSFLFLLVGFERKVMQICKDIMGPKS